MLAAAKRIGTVAVDLGDDERLGPPGLHERASEGCAGNRVRVGTLAQAALRTRWQDLPWSLRVARSVYSA